MPSGAVAWAWPAPAPAASTGASRVLAVWQEKHMSGLRGGLDGGGLGDDEGGEQVGAPPDVGVDVAGVGVEADRPDAPVGPVAHVGGALGAGEVAQLGTRDR